jgi:signal transduction histidine kinase
MQWHRFVLRRPPLRHLALWNAKAEAETMRTLRSLSVTSLSGRFSGSIVLQYASAIAAVLIALLVSRALNPYVGDRVAFVLLLPAVAFSAWYCGLGPSTVATVLALAGATYGFFPPIHPLPVLPVSELVIALVFLFASVLVVVMGESRRRHNEALRIQQGALESRVQERTVDLDMANRNLRELSARLLQLQDDERRRIARELHDSVGQMLAALSMNLSAVRSDVERLAKTALALSDSENLVQEMSTEVRTISHLLHPPLLDEAGLLSALRWYVDGFAQRSKIKVDLDLPDGFGRLPRESETAIFRVIQECLTNIHRHSGSPAARIRLRQRDQQVLVEIEDKGKGIPPEKQKEMSSAGAPGVGVRGMRERLRQLGGTLEINSGVSGTVVTVWLPIAESPANSVEVHDTPSPAAA